MMGGFTYHSNLIKEALLLGGPRHRSTTFLLPRGSSLGDVGPPPSMFV